MKDNKLKYLLPIRSIIFIIVFTVGAYITGKELKDITNCWSIIATIVNIITLLILIKIIKKEKTTFAKFINFRKGRTNIREIAIVSLIMLIIGTGGMYLAGFICYGKFPYAAPMMIEPINQALAIVNLLVLPVTVAFAEEGLYLGCGVNSFEDKYKAIFIPAFFYALQHCFIPTLFDIRYIIYRFLSFLPLTIILCWYYHKNKNPLPIMIGHALIEVASVVMILITSVNPEVYQRILNM